MTDARIAAIALAAHAREHDGYTARRSTLKVETLRSGFAVGAAPDCEAVLDLLPDGGVVLVSLGKVEVAPRRFDDLAAAIAWWIRSVCPPAICCERIGAWIAGGRCYLDCSVVVETLAAARAIGEVFGELTVYDAAGGRCLPVADDDDPHNDDNNPDAYGEDPDDGGDPDAIDDALLAAWLLN